MSASSRSTIFSLRSKKSKDSAELKTHAGPAYDALPMSPRPPISVPTIIPPSQQNGRGDSTKSRYGNDYFDDDSSSDALSVRSESRNGYGHQQGSRGGSISVASLGGVSGPRPLPPRSGSAEKMHESWKYDPLGYVPATSNVPCRLHSILILETPQETCLFRSWIDTVSRFKFVLHYLQFT